MPSKKEGVANANPLVRIMVFGTFDMVHSGHLNMFKQARALAKRAFLIVSIARDKNVERIKGRSSRHGEKARMQQVGMARGVDKVVLGAAGDHIPHIVKEKPDIIALGYDQKAYVKGLKAALKAAGLHTKVVRLSPHKPHIYKTSLILKKS